MAEKSIVYELKRNLERQRFQTLMSLSDDQLRIMNSNERLGSAGLPEEIRSRSLDEKQYIGSWNYINDLGVEYHELVKQGYGTSVQTRNARQREIAEIIAGRTLPYIKKIVYKIVNGPGLEIYRHGQRRVIQIKNCNTPIKDMVQEGAAAVIGKMHRYDPERGNIGTFISHTIIAPLQKAADNDEGVLLLPKGETISKARKLVTESTSRSEAIKEIMEKIKIYGKAPSGDVASALYHGMKKGYVDIDKPVMDREETFANYYLKDKSEEADLEEKISMERRKEHMAAALAQLNPIDQKVLRLRFGFSDDEAEYTLRAAGKEMGISKERIRQLETRALQRLRALLEEMGKKVEMF